MGWNSYGEIGSKLGRSLWATIHTVTGTPPTMLAYYPPNGKYRAEWVIHHEGEMFRFKGGAKEIINHVVEKGLCVNSVVLNTPTPSDRLP